MTTGMEHLSNEEVVQLAQLAITELARRTGQPMQPPVPQDPFRAMLAAAAAGSGVSAQRPPGTPLMQRPQRAPAQGNFSITSTPPLAPPMPPGFAFANAHTDPAAAAAFGAVRPRLDDVPGVIGNGVGAGGAVALEP